MKKLIFYIFTVIFLTGVFIACEEEEDVLRRGVTIFVSSSSFYPLDPGASGNIEVSDPSVTAIEVLVDGTKIQDLTLSDGAGTYSFDKASLGISEIEDETTVKFLAQVDGQPAARNVGFVVEDPLTKSGPSDIPPVDTTIKIYYTLAEDCTAPTSLTITETVNSGDPTTLAGDYDMFEDSLIVAIDPTQAGDTLTYTFTFANANGTVVTSHELLVIVKRFWDFESYEAWSTDFDPWTLVDNDGLGVYGVSAFDYPGSGDPGSWRIIDYVEAAEAEADEAWEPYSGDKMVFCMAAVPDGDNGNDDWLISDAFDIEAGYSLSFYAKSITDAYGLERMIVTIVDNDSSEETVLTADPYAEVPTDWTNYSWDLDDYAGKNITVKIGCVSYDAFALFIDDFMIDTGEEVLKREYKDHPSIGYTEPVKVR